MALDGDAADTLSPEVLFEFIGHAINDTGSRPAPGASGEFGSHAIRPRSRHHMQLMIF
jgi:hypothetical protein